MRQASTPKVILLLSLPLIFLLIFYFYPLTKITLLSFSGDTTGQTGIGTLLSSPVYGRILWFTTWQAALSTFLTLLVALPGAYVFSQYSFPGKNLLMSLSTVPFVLPTVVTAAAFSALLGSNGIVNSWFVPLLHLDYPLVSIDQSVAFFLLAHVFYNYALVLRIVSGYWSGISPELKSAAQMLGAPPSMVFFKITLPLLLPAIASSALLVFIFCFTSFGVVLILGGPACATIEVEIYRQAVQLFNLPMAATLSLIQIGINFLFMWLHAVMTRKAQVSFISGSSIQPGFRAQGFREKCMLFGNLGFMLTLLVAPLLALLISSLAGPDGFTFSYYSTLFHGDTRSLFYVPPAEALRNSIGFAVLTMLLALFFGSFAAIGLSSS